jgi:hypothetical protein
MTSVGAIRRCVVHAAIYSPVLALLRSNFESNADGKKITGMQMDFPEPPFNDKIEQTGSHELHLFIARCVGAIMRSAVHIALFSLALALLRSNFDSGVRVSTLTSPSSPSISFSPTPTSTLA